MVADDPLPSLQHDGVNRNRFFGVLASSVRPEDFYAGLARAGVHAGSRPA